jgi:hypothetical protein
MAELNDLHARLAESSGTDADSVRKVLDALGLEKALAQVAEISPGRSVQVSDLKLAVRLGRNAVAV